MSHREPVQRADPALGAERLLTAKDAASLLRLSTSYLAKARMRGDGPAYLKLGRAIRYRDSDLLDWVKSRSRVSTSRCTDYACSRKNG
jgi:predicted DNA-binding transcriptional regulator AlpA